MKSQRLMAVATVVVFAALAIPIQLAAQDKQDNKHHHYQLIDMGTLGGAQSTVAPGRVLNNEGTVVGCADISTPDPNYPNFNPFLSPFGADPFIFHTFEFQEGTVIDMGAIPGVNSSCESFLTDGGLTVGGSANGSVDPLTGWPAMEAVVWQDGQVINLGTLGGNESFSIWANNRGQVVGAAANTIADPFSVFFGWGTQTRAFLWEGGALQDLGTLGGPDALATMINDRGQIFGASYTSDIPNPLTGIPPFDGFLYEHGKMMDIPNGFGGTQVNPFWANNRGELVGNASFPDEQTFHPFFWSKGKFIDLGTFGGTFGEAVWINEAGAVTGQASPPPGNTIVHAFLWRRGVLSDLGTVDGDACSGGFSINSTNQIVGVSFACDGSVAHAFLWEKGQIVDLNTLVSPGGDLQLAAGADINDSGEIVGVGALANGNNHAFLLIPCDENHPGIEGCDYSMVDAGTAVVQTSPAARNASSRTLPQSLSRRMNRYRFPSLGALPRN